MSNKTNEKHIVSQIYKATEWVIVSFLYLVFVYWVAWSFYKYMEEPTSTYIKGEIGFFEYQCDSKRMLPEIEILNKS